MTKTQTRPRGSVVTPGGIRLSADEVIADYRLAVRSRAASLIGRREVLTGKAPFGIFGDGKEVAQLAMAKTFRDGDWRSGYYRDQTLMLATGMATLPEFFAQLYANPDVTADPHSAGRQMSCHFATRSLDDDGHWRSLVGMKNSASDLAPVAAQMPRSVGIAYASKLYRQSPGLADAGRDFSRNGDEVCFATSGNAGVAEGPFWETLNAAGVLGVPLAISIWDDGYGISVPNALAVTKGSVSEIVSGFAREAGGGGYDIHVVRGWDYPALCDTYAEGIERVRREHVPALFHVTEMTQPQGHSTSGSHERYKPKERLAFETEMDPIAKLRTWIVQQDIATDRALAEMEREDRGAVEEMRVEAWEAYQSPIRVERDRVAGLLDRAAAEAPDIASLGELAAELRRETEQVTRSVVQSAAARAALALAARSGGAKDELTALVAAYRLENDERHNSHLHSRSDESPLRVAASGPTYAERPESIDGRLILTRYFDALLARDPRVFIIGEDVAKLGGVNLEFEGLNAKYGDLRITDTGIREATILGQGIGAALRGLRPLVDIQYADYVLYALQIASDDLATLHFRTHGGQKAPVIIRTKGHRLQGIWHTGSPMGMILGTLRGLHVCVPRDMTRAVGFYNTLFRGDDPAIVVEVLSGYRLKERVPEDLATYTLPLGVPEVLRPGDDVTIVTYGACVRLALDAASILDGMSISAEVIDVQTLLPFDAAGSIVGSLRRTGALLVLDEDVPGGASAYLMQEILERQSGFEYLDATPRTLTAKANRAPVGVDGDYFAKPNREDIVEAVYGLMHERRPEEFPAL